MTPPADRKPAQVWALLSLLLANLWPVAGVYFWGWSLTELLMLYWLESAVIGVFTVLRMITAHQEGQPLLAQVGVKMVTVPFFLFHYGLFWLVHGVFLVILFARDAIPAVNGLNTLLFLPINYSLSEAALFAWPLALMLLSHGVDFVSGYLVTGENRRSAPQRLMMQPYARVFVLHITIIVGAFLVLAAGQSRMVLLLFVMLKIVADVLAHMRGARRGSVSQVAAV